MTTTAIQVPAPKVDVQQPVTQQPKPGQSFKDVMQAAQQTQKPQAAQKPQTAQKPQADSKPQQNPAAEAKDPVVITEDGKQIDVSTLEETGILTTTGDGRADALRGMFMGLLGVSVADVDFSQSDADILKDLMKHCTDPEQQFALMLMMAFLQANPDYTLDDLMGQMPETGAAQTGASPVNVVMNAIQKLMLEDENVNSFPLMDSAKALLESGADAKSTFAQLAKALNVQSVTVSESEGGFMSREQGGMASQEDPQAALLMQGKMRSAVEQIKQALNSGKDDNSKTDIERLQQQVDSGVFLRSTNVYAAKTGAAVYMPTGAELVDQVRTGIMTSLADAKSEFVMQLKPEGLGELTVKLTEMAGKMTLTLTAANAQTQRLLESQLPSLREVMKPYEVEVEHVVNAKDDSAARFGGAFGEQFGEHRHQSTGDEPHRGGFWYGEDAEEDDSAPAWEAPSTETIDTYI